MVLLLEGVGHDRLYYARYYIVDVCSNNMEFRHIHTVFYVFCIECRKIFIHLLY